MQFIKVLLHEGLLGRYAGSFGVCRAWNQALEKIREVQFPPNPKELDMV
jgi:hypothetical protein